jgi:hypothetical protein
MAHGDAREGKWRGDWRMEWVASTRHTTSEHGVSSITTADAHTSAASSRLNWRPHRFKCSRLFRRKTKSGFCACSITFQLAFTTWQRCFGGTTITSFMACDHYIRLSRWSRCLRRRSAAARLLGLRVRISAGAWISVSYECCVFSEVSATGRYLVQRSPVECDVSECDFETLTLRRPKL